ncbi:MAG: cytochrome c peroxidase [Bacteroidota bacterium]
MAQEKLLFYDKALSLDSSFSCATCHQPEKGFTDGRAFSLGQDGKDLDRSAMSLVNLLWVDQFFWDGRSPSLEDQVLGPLFDPREMGMTEALAIQRLKARPMYPPLFKKAFGSSQISLINIQKALAQFERTLISANSRYDQIVRGEVKATERELRAINLFMTHPVPDINLRGANCGDCHGSHLTTLNTFHNNGLDSTIQDPGLGGVNGLKSDLGKMRVPSLRNIALTAPYMHDGRFQTLEAVLDHYNEHIQNAPNLDPLIMEASNEPDGGSLLLTKEEKEDIILFLHMLTDSSFIENPAFQDPFLKKD